MSETRPTAIHTTSPVALPEGVREGNKNLVCLTAAAGMRATELIGRECKSAYLRVAIHGGGCNGLIYRLDFTAQPLKGDILVRTAGIPVLVDSRTALYLKGTQIEYSERAAGDGFVFTNPNAKAGCACG